jgi:signal transduction histidine kinase
MDPLLLIFRVAVLGLAGYLWWSSRRLTRENAVLRAELEEREVAQAATAGRQSVERERLEALEETVEGLREDLQTKQEQLVRARQLASLGQLTGGIAHEIKNPLNFVNNFARLSTELAHELQEILDERSDEPVRDVMDEVAEILADIEHNAEKIVEHGGRADATVRNMLLHARQNADQRQPTDLNKLFADYANLAYHGMRAADPQFNATLVRELDPAVGEVEVVPQDLGRVVINLVNNAFYAVHERKQATADGSFEPTVTIHSEARNGDVELRVTDNGAGIPEEVRDRVFEPFVTTKPPGVGTGLGLSLSYEIVTQAHAGALDVETRSEEGTTFVITIPRDMPSNEPSHGQPLG